MQGGNGRIQTYVKMVRDRNSILVAFPLSIIGWATALYQLSYITKLFVGLDGFEPSTFTL